MGNTKPFSVERTKEPLPRLRQLSASRYHDSEYEAEEGALVYHSEAFRCWILLRNEGYSYVLEFYEECPCEQ